MVERQKLGYIQGTVNSFTPGKGHSTKLALTYVHDPTEPIGVPLMSAKSDEATTVWNEENFLTQ
jgi:hypothetical protein